MPTVKTGETVLEFCISSDGAAHSLLLVFHVDILNVFLSVLAQTAKTTDDLGQSVTRHQILLHQLPLGSPRYNLVTLVCPADEYELLLSGKIPQQLSKYIEDYSHRVHSSHNPLDLYGHSSKRLPHHKWDCKLKTRNKMRIENKNIIHVDRGYLLFCCEYNKYFHRE